MCWSGHYIWSLSEGSCTLGKCSDRSSEILTGIDPCEERNAAGVHRRHHETPAEHWLQIRECEVVLCPISRADQFCLHKPPHAIIVRCIRNTSLASYTAAIPRPIQYTKELSRTKGYFMECRTVPLFTLPLRRCDMEVQCFVHQGTCFPS